MAMLAADGPVQPVEKGPAAGNELRAAGRRRTWIVRLGETGANGSLDAFLSAFSGLAARDAGDGVLDDVGDLSVNDLRRRAFPVSRDVDDWKVDLGKLADPQVAIAQIAEHDHGGRQHDREDRILDADIGESHAGYRLMAKSNSPVLLS